ncbi:hypothetical protein FOCC_FOCC011851 [Frankliniella occidentalis]|nr:hypothetical protein FOCC_FOCC011851 [Frankliniella occidentalis]
MAVEAGLLVVKLTLALVVELTLVLVVELTLALVELTLALVVELTLVLVVELTLALVVTVGYRSEPTGELALAVEFALMSEVEVTFEVAAVVGPTADSGVTCGSRVVGRSATRAEEPPGPRPCARSSSITDLIKTTAMITAVSPSSCPRPSATTPSTPFPFCLHFIWLALFYADLEEDCNKNRLAESRENSMKKISPNKTLMKTTINTTSAEFQQRKEESLVTAATESSFRCFYGRCLRSTARSQTRIMKFNMRLRRLGGVPLAIFSRARNVNTVLWDMLYGARDGSPREPYPRRAGGHAQPAAVCAGMPNLRRSQSSPEPVVPRLLAPVPAPRPAPPEKPRSREQSPSRHTIKTIGLGATEASTENVTNTSGATEAVTNTSATTEAVANTSATPEAVTSIISTSTEALHSSRGRSATADWNWRKYTACVEEVGSSLLLILYYLSTVSSSSKIISYWNRMT